MTALAGQVLRLNGEPLADVTLEVEGGTGSPPATARTDDTGRFLLTGVAVGHTELLIDGRSANGPGRTYGVFEVGVDLTEEETTVLPYTIWMPKIDTAHAAALPSPTTGEVVVTTPRIRDLEVRIPAGAVLRDHERQVVREVSITPIPLDRPPFPLPEGVDVPLYFATTSTGADGTPFQYTGRENDGTGFYYYRARYYHPGLARFIAQDPVGCRAGVNFYAFVSNQPLRYADPLGLEKTEPAPDIVPVRLDRIDPLPDQPIDPGVCWLSCLAVCFGGVCSGGGIPNPWIRGLCVGGCYPTCFYACFKEPASPEQPVFPVIPVFPQNPWARPL